jgi:V/A-type H+-transporting ATPase subunit D
MQLLRLKKRLALARRGHKLLKDKLDGLVQKFFGVKDQYLKLYRDLEPRLTRIFTQAVLASALSHPSSIEKLSSGEANARVQTTVQNIMGVRIPAYVLISEGEPPPPPPTLLASSELFRSRASFSSILPGLIDLAALSQSLRLMAREIIETRRRVNALEYVLIPELERNLRYIRMKLSELERASQVVLLKIKDIVRAH